MDGFDLEQGTYRTPPRRLAASARLSPTAHFYGLFLNIVFRSANLAKRGRYGDKAWENSSHDTRHALEAAGVRFHVTGLEHVMDLETPCVFAANHMSMMETVVLPGLIRPFLPVTFVVKDSLIRYPLFKHVMLTRDPIVVTRTDPRQDLQTVMREGQDRLAKGISVIVFPQTTRTTRFRPSRFNSIGAKLARRAGVPVVPVALRTDGWTNGRPPLKDLGRIDPTKPAEFAFGAPIHVEGRGTEAHEATVAFIAEKLERWGLPPERQ